MSCIAGPRQFGNEDQGWVAHFLYSVLAGQPITIYGDGFQTRDILHVQDLLDAMELARVHATHTRGEIYNVGGSVERAISVADLLQQIKDRTGRPLHLHHSAVRPGDQPLFISSTRKLSAHTGWQPRHSLGRILDDLQEFWQAHRAEIASNHSFAAVGESVPEMQEVSA